MPITFKNEGRKYNLSGGDLKDAISRAYEIKERAERGGSEDAGDDKADAPEMDCGIAYLGDEAFRAAIASDWLRAASVGLGERKVAASWRQARASLIAAIRRELSPRSAWFALFAMSARGQSMSGSADTRRWASAASDYLRERYALS